MTLFTQRFRYEQFQEGQVYFKDGKKSPVAKFNYDLITGEVLFIPTLGDTLPVHNEKIDFFKIGNTVFINGEKEVIEIIYGNEVIKLGVNKKFNVKRKERVSGDGYSTGYDATGSSSSARGVVNDVILQKMRTYYISVGGGARIIKAIEPKILRAFPLQKRALQNYVKENKVDFNSEGDLMQLVYY